MPCPAKYCLQLRSGNPIREIGYKKDEGSLPKRDQLLRQGRSFMDDHGLDFFEIFHLCIISIQYMGIIPSKPYYDIGLETNDNRAWKV